MKLSVENAKKSIADLQGFYEKYINFLTKYVVHLLLLAIRVHIGWIFFNSGLTKIANIDNTIILFAYEYSLPFIKPELGAYLSIFNELVFGGAIIIGLLTRLVALPLIGMTLVIQFLVIQNPEHYYWLFLLSTLAIYGGGKLSAEGLACKFCKCPFGGK